MGSLSPETLERLLNEPALPAPPGVEHNFVNPSNENTMGVALIATQIVIATIFGLIRAYSKIFCVKRVRFEDYLAVAGYGCYIGGTVMMTGIPRGIGFFVNQWNVHTRDMEGFIYSYAFSTVLFCAALLFWKTSILLEWTRFFVPTATRNSFFWICHVLIWANISLYIAIIITINFTCSPRERLWHRWIPGTCLNINAINLSATIFPVVFNSAILLLPHRVIWTLQLSKQQRIGVSIVFSMGILSCVCAAGRVAAAAQLISSGDTTYGYSRYLMWGFAETTTIALVFCVPAVPIAFRRSGPMSRLKTFIHANMRSIHPGRDTPHNIPSRTWPATSSIAAPAGTYHRMGEPPSMHMDDLSTKAIERQQAKARQLEHFLRNNGGILRVTEIVTYEESSTRHSAGQDAHHIHPWVERDAP
jgi:hypothetical protein